MSKVNILQLFSISLLVLACAPASGQDSFPEYEDEDVNEICEGVPCPKHHYCRVVKHCERPKCHPEFACVPCVPDGSDDNCNSKGFMYAVLYGYPHKEGSLVPMDCSSDGKCPKGSKCIVSPTFKRQRLGICCYGGPGPAPVANTDAICPVCNPLCKKEQTCQKRLNECGIEETFCAPHRKRGTCPKPSRHSFNIGHYCTTDSGCPGVMKCCGTGHGGFDCRYPIYE